VTANKVTVRDHGANALQKQLKQLGRGATIRVGILTGKAEEQHKKSALQVVDVAGFHEFGAGVPRRSWLRDWVDADQSRINAVLSKVPGLIMHGKQPAYDVLLKAGLKLVTYCRERIRNRLEPPLTEATIRAKGSSVPLIDTGQLITSITTEVVAQGRAVAKGAP
jgi:hypothetical protein